MKGIIPQAQIIRGYRAGKPLKLVFVSILAVSLDAAACGWAGDGELKYDTLLQEITSGGRPIPQTLDLESIRLPGSFGYGMVVVEPGQGIPYLQSTFGRPISQIEDLRAFGIRTVIDLGSGDTFSEVKLNDGKPRSLRNFNIPVEPMAPSVTQIENFHDLLLDAGNRPLLVVAPSAEILAVTWAAYRLHLGAPLAYAIYEGKSIGLQSEQESVLRDRRQN
ncbi:MAG: hypothetical protein OEU50_09535 [Gammaproteobacteria bacterium]|nr:hypothetical protein [Gammaproteobacteria bacterium]